MLETHAAGLTKQLAEEKDKSAHLANSNAKFERYICQLQDRGLEETRHTEYLETCKYELECRLKHTEGCLNQQCLQLDDLQHQLLQCKEQLTEALTMGDHSQKALSDLESQLAEVSTVFSII
jgi:chromosome segregation ATPase